jgi:hypothetical protein
MGRANGKKAVGFLIFVALLGIVIGGHYFHWGCRAVSTYDNKPLPVSRKYYPLRHWAWSGIPGEAGAGFIADPHFLASDAMSFSDPAMQILPVRNATFRTLDVNPFFNDRTSEILLLITAGRATSEYSLEFPKGQNVQVVIAFPDLPMARLVPNEKQLVLIADFFGPAKGIYLVPLPLESGALTLVPVTDPQFDSISKEFRTLEKDVSTEVQFCEAKSKPFEAFYEKYIGRCTEGSSGNPGAATAESFNQFWK